MELEQTKVQMNRICQILFSGDELSLFLNELLDLIKTPIVATCVLHHVKTLITKERDYISEPLPLHFALIDQIAALHSNLHGRYIKFF
jgi:hypothetical protein